MATTVTKKYHGRIRRWGKALYLRDVCLPDSLINIVEEKYYEGVGHTVEMEIPRWLYQKDKFQSLHYWELDQDNNYINRKSNDKTGN